MAQTMAAALCTHVVGEDANLAKKMGTSAKLAGESELALPVSGAWPRLTS